MATFDQTTPERRPGASGPPGDGIDAASAPGARPGIDAASAPGARPGIDAASAPGARPGIDVVDVRGPRFSAALTSAVLAIAFLTRSAPLLAAQVAVFGVGALAGLRWSPYGNLFRLLKRRLDWIGPPPATEPASGPRFSQTLGFLCSGAGLVAVLVGQETLGWALVLAVLALSTLLAATGLCIGCELHAVGLRLRGSLAGGRGDRA